jgi:hypothetical protein
MDKKQLFTPIKVLFIGCVLALFAVVSPFIFRPNADDSSNLAIARTSLSALTVPIVLFGFCFTTIQLRKALARPKIKVAFDEKGEQQTTLTYTDDNPGSISHPLLINEGTSISRYFQIVVKIPKNIERYEARNLRIYHTNIYFKDNDKEFTDFIYTNDGEYTLFVNQPYDASAFLLEHLLDYKKCVKECGNGFSLSYKIFGDWGEPQTGELTVMLKKQDVSHA